MKIAILGFGQEGQSLLRFLKKHRDFQDSEIWILDKNPKAKIPRGLKKQTGTHYLKNLAQFDLVFRSPGIPYNLPELKRARAKRVKFSSATKLFFERSPARIIGVTGSKGKTTTATLLFKMLKASGFRVFLGGNIGNSSLDLLPRLRKNSWVILELSSFQLQDLTRSPHIAVVLDIFPEHQDAHASLREYYGAKANIARYQKPGDLIFYLPETSLTRKIAAKGRGKKIPVDSKEPAWLPVNTEGLRGGHMKRNAAVAAAVGLRLGVNSRIVAGVVKRFRGVEHRLEFVRRIKNVAFYNDSASTNPHTAAAAVQAFQGKTKVLIAGGYDKGLGYKPLARALKTAGPEMKLVILFGQNKKKIQKAVKRSGVPIQFAKSLSAAVKAAYRSAKRLSNVHGQMSNVIVLFSPGAASFDMFRNYADRGKRFKKSVKAL